MGTIEILLIVWGVVTAVLICTMIYRSTLETREEDQIFLDPAGESMAREQRAIVARIEKLGRPITALAVLSGLILATIVGIWLYQGYRSF
ncbi:MAG TPA: hypothetical protein VMM16_14005 [Verrucomicrobiae bacterium]|nr:hypothetical protein [Verrucomicrobiae bacterium]